MPMSRISIFIRDSMASECGVGGSLFGGKSMADGAFITIRHYIPGPGRAGVHDEAIRS
jgi:hypothetical protein